VGTIGHVDHGKSTLLGTGLGRSIGESLKSLKMNSVVAEAAAPYPIAFTGDNKRVRNRGSKPSPAERLLLLQQQRRKR
jgi:translation elongation factor EF-1alpha